MSRILLTGGNGFVAGAVLAQAPESIALHALSRGPIPFEAANVAEHRYKQIRREDFEPLFDLIQPDAVLHTAAIAAIDYCEEHRDEAWQVNVKFPRIIAELCAERGARMIHCSTDNVFDGARGLYTEDDSPHPVNYYGETKVAAEQAVASALENHLIARVAIVYGLTIVGTGNSFLEKMLPKLRAGERMGVPQQEIRSPIDVATLGQALLELCTQEYRGVLHLANNDRLNRVELVQRIARHLGLPPELVYANDPTDIPGRAPRPLDVSLSNKKAAGLLETSFVSIEEGMDRVNHLVARLSPQG